RAPMARVHFGPGQAAEAAPLRRALRAGGGGAGQSPPRPRAPLLPRLRAGRLPVDDTQSGGRGVPRLRARTLARAAVPSSHAGDREGRPMSSSWRVLEGDACAVLATIATGTV